MTSPHLNLIPTQVPQSLQHLLLLLLLLHQKMYLQFQILQLLRISQRQVHILCKTLTQNRTSKLMKDQVTMMLFLTKVLLSYQMILGGLLLFERVFTHATITLFHVLSPMKACLQHLRHSHSRLSPLRYTIISMKL